MTTITRIARKITRLSVLSCDVIGQEKKAKAVTSQKSFCSSVSQTLFFGGEKRPPEIRLRSQDRRSPRTVQVGISPLKLPQLLAFDVTVRQY